MPATYLDQFWVLDPSSPPADGTTLTVEKYELVDQDDDGDISRGKGDDTVNGQEVTNAYPGDTVTVQLEDGSTTTIEGITFYLADGSVVFTPTDGSALDEASFVSSTYVTKNGSLDVSEDLGPPCLVAGTLVATPEGPVPVEMLKAGMTVTAQDGRSLTLRMVLSSSFTARDVSANGALAPVRIVAGAMGNGLPQRDLLVSRQHRMLVNAPVVARLFDSAEVLLPAIKLTQLPGIYVDSSLPVVTYYHLVFDQHEIILTEGAATESLFTGPEGLRAMPDAAREELYLMFPGLKAEGSAMTPARLIPTGPAQNELIERLKRSAGTTLYS
ncbi:Hint domain-containing protein [Cognatishimia sp. SS12]|uniref:Hint domain-containing protein n=1 Tax=Cognatishimia sp. SS12 TaxID=2979465 RepID=UPI00232E2B41|nr:Hint domain-containing protein [Cognatishimia sp. SS12]MDC0738030.1 Hint domain-containing protein [Cognatishimia sp. SS12]